MPCRTSSLVLSCALILTLLSPGSVEAGERDAPDTLAPVLWLEQVEKGDRPLLQAIPKEDPRFQHAERLIDNEAARLTRTLVAWAWASFGRPASWPDGRLPIVLREGGNHAALGFRLRDGDRTAEHPDVPYIILELDAKSLSDTVIHEGGHLLQTIAAGGRRATPPWSPLVHSTFAVTDPITALSEGYGIHFEALAGHYGQEPERRRFYHRLAPDFDLQNTKRAEFYSPITDLLTFAQSWARYQAVRETWTVFAGHVYPGEYLRSQYDPARDRSMLLPANAMVASEGAVASALFWISASLAADNGATPGGGLSQRGVIEAECALLRGLAAARTGDRFRPDVVDVVSAIGDSGSKARALAISRFVSVTRGVTADPDVRQRWTALYLSALVLDGASAKPLFATLDASRTAIVESANADVATLRRRLGPVIPVRQEKVLLEIKAFGETFPLEFDLNASSESEWAAAGVGPAIAVKALAERDRMPFKSLEDFEQRVGRDLASLGLVPAPVASN